MPSDRLGLYWITYQADLIYILSCESNALSDLDLFLEYLRGNQLSGREPYFRFGPTEIDKQGIRKVR